MEVISNITSVTFQKKTDEGQVDDTKETSGGDKGESILIVDTPGWGDVDEEKRELTIRHYWCDI